MKKYFVYELKKNLLPLACLTLFCIVMYVLPISTTSYYGWNHYLESDHSYYYKPSLYYSTITVALGIISVFIPIVMFAYKMNKRSVDMHYSLPISKTKILAVNFLVGLILMYASYSIAYLWGFILIAIKAQRLHLIYYLYLYLASIIPAFITYAVTSFIFTRANTIIDGIISVAGALCMIAMAVATFNLLSVGNISGVEGMYFFPFTPLSQTATIFGKAIINGYCDKWLMYEVGSHWYNVDVCRLISSILWLLIAVAATIGMFVTEKKSKAENCGQITESPFCYKIQIPAYTIMFAAVFADNGIVALCAIAFAVFVWSIIYKRSIKIGWKFGVALITSMLGGALLMAINRVWIFGIVVLSLLIAGVIVWAVVLRIRKVKSR